MCEINRWTVTFTWNKVRDLGFILLFIKGLGYFGKEENYWIAEKLKNVFSEWIDNGHNDFDDENTIILCIELTDGLLLSHGTRYEF